MYILEIGLNQHVISSKARSVGTSLATHSALAQPTKGKAFHIQPLFQHFPTMTQPNISRLIYWQTLTRSLFLSI